MSRQPDDPTSLPAALSDVPVEAREPSAQPNSDLAREGEAVTIEKKMEIANVVGATAGPSEAAIKEFRDRVNALREMGREKYAEQTREVARRIIPLIRKANPLPDDVRAVRSNGYDGHPAAAYKTSMYRLRDAELADATPDGAIIPDLSFDPEYPVSLLIKSGNDTAFGRIHWALWKQVEKSLSDEDTQFMRTVYLKTTVAQNITSYTQARAYLNQAGLDLDNPELFEAE